MAALLGTGGFLTLLEARRIEAAHPASGRFVGVDGGRLHVLEITRRLDVRNCVPSYWSMAPAAILTTFALRSATGWPNAAASSLSIDRDTAGAIAPAAAPTPRLHARRR